MNVGGFLKMSTDLKKGLEGVLHLHSETGTEGGHWAFQDAEYISRDGRSWSYEGLHILKDGDQLTIYHPKSKEQVWSGCINLRPLPHFTESAKDPERDVEMWIKEDQIGVEREIWAGYFGHYKAELMPAEN